jgi:iron complex transport system permease protein
MMGGLYNSNWDKTFSVAPIMMICLAILFLLRWRINLLSLPDRTGHTLGIRVAKERILLLFIATVATTAIISVAGLISWVGLIIPHLSRRLFTSDSRYALGGSMIMGALFLLVSDTIGRTLLPSEIPLGIITSLFGAILFIFILSSKQSEVNL